MANEEHLAILRQGVHAWNLWRAENPGTKPDLVTADLKGADLQGVNLKWSLVAGAIFAEADFAGAELDGANFQTCDLRGARFNLAQMTGVDLVAAKAANSVFQGALIAAGSLGHADFQSADFRGADLDSVDLTQSDLSRATLHAADLRRAHLNEVILAGADLTESIFSDTAVVNLDLSEACGLDAVRHEGPSSIGIDTIFRSKGKIPEAFLRGAGVPEPFIVQMQALVGALEPIQFYSCFISYSSKDQDFADLLHSQLQSKGARVWLATEDLRIGDKFRTKIDEAIRLYDKLLLVLTQDSVKSPWVESEVEAALEKERRQKRTVLFPIRLDDAVMEADEAWASDIRRTRHVGDFCGWKDHDKYKKAFERLMRDLKAE